MAEHRRAQRIGLIVGFIFMTTQAIAADVYNPNDDTWSKVGWTMGWVEKCMMTKYETTASLHRRVKGLAEREEISDGHYRKYAAMRGKMKGMEAGGCTPEKVKKSVQALDVFITRQERD